MDVTTPMRSARFVTSAGHRPRAVAVHAASNRALVAHYGDAALLAVDLASGDVTRLQQLPRGTVFAGLVGAAGPLLAVAQDGTITSVDPDGGAILHQMRVDKFVRSAGLATDRSTIVLATGEWLSSSHELVAIDIHRRRVAAQTVLDGQPSCPLELMPGVWVDLCSHWHPRWPSRHGVTLTLVDAQAGRVLTSLELPDGGSLTGSASQGALFILRNDTGVVQMYDTTLTLQAEFGGLARPGQLCCTADGFTAVRGTRRGHRLCEYAHGRGGPHRTCTPLRIIPRTE